MHQRGTPALGAYFGRPTESLARRLVGEQLDDVGWNYEAPKSARSSFHTTICVLERLLEYERAVGSAPEIAGARGRGDEYLLERGLFRRRECVIQCSRSPRIQEISMKPVGNGDMMTTVAASPGNRANVATGFPGRRFDNLFFSAMALLILGTVFLGFARTYYLAGVFHAPLPAFIIHVHGAAFSCWVLLLVTQTALVSAGRADIHRRLGILGFLLACSMVVLGVLAGTNALARGFTPPGLDAATFYVVPITDMLIFGTLIFFAFRNRTDSPAHKRLILVSTIALLIAAIARWPFAVFLGKPIAAGLFSYVFLLLLVAYDLWSIRKVHRATLWAGIFLIIVQQIRIPIGQTSAWHAFASWAQSLGS